MHEVIKLSQHHLLKLSGSCRQNQLTINVRAYFWDFSSISSIHMFILMTVPLCLGYNSFVVGFETGNVSLQLFHFQVFFFGGRGEVFYISTRINGQFLKRNYLEFWWGLHWVCRWILEICLLMHEDEISIVNKMFA